MWSAREVEAGVSGDAGTSNGSDVFVATVAACEASRLSRLSTAVEIDAVCPIFCKDEIYILKALSDCSNGDEGS